MHTFYIFCANAYVYSANTAKFYQTGIAHSSTLEKFLHGVNMFACIQNFVDIFFNVKA